jgi:predicted dithiol-disulfide oxidoreductase (DUF899 family)
MLKDSKAVPKALGTIVSAQEWEAGRQQFRVKEKALTHASEALAA